MDVDPRPCLCGGAPYVDSLTWTLLMWSPLRGLSYVGLASVDPLPGAPYVDSLTWTLLIYVEALSGPM